MADSAVRPDERAAYLLAEVIKHADENGDLANATGDELRDALALAAEALRELNRLRSNVIATQSASWSNAMYPMVAILDRTGCELIRDVTPEDMADHMLCYGGAGGSPDHLTPDARKGDLWRQRLSEAKERGTALQRLHAGGSKGHD